MQPARPTVQVSQASRTHLFISYAVQDSALASWLARKLSLAGYAVWFDRMKLLGGEPWPQDIDVAIKERSFRMLAILSENSIKKPNPSKERALALQIDKGSSRSAIFDVLIAGKIPFIDVGMGLKRKGDPLSGMLRVTYYPVDRAEEVRAKGYAEMSDPADNLYRTNIQIGELNALNACLAVVKYKEVRGFYGNNEPMDNYLFDVSDMKVAS